MHYNILTRKIKPEVLRKSVGGKYMDEAAMELQKIFLRMLIHNRG